MNKAQIVAIVLGVVVIAGAVFSYSRSMPSNEEIFAKVSEQIYSSKFLREKVDASFVIKDKKMTSQYNLAPGVYPKAAFSIDQIVFSNDWHDPYKEGVKGTANIKFSVENITENPTKADLDIIIPEEMLFFIRLNELTGTPIDLASIESKWWKVDVKGIAKSFAGKEADKILESTEKSKLSKEQIEELEVIVKKHNPVVLKKMSDGEIEGVPAYRFNATLDKAQLASMLLEVSELVQKNSENKQEVEISDIEEGLKRFNLKSMEVYVGKKDYLPVQLKLLLDIQDENSQTLADADMSITVSASKPVEIKAPLESTDILYLIGNLFSMFQGGLVPQN